MYFSWLNCQCIYLLYIFRVTGQFIKLKIERSISGSISENWTFNVSSTSEPIERSMLAQQVGHPYARSLLDTTVHQHGATDWIHNSYKHSTPPGNFFYQGQRHRSKVKSQGKRFKKILGNQITWEIIIGSLQFFYVTLLMSMEITRDHLIKCLAFHR